MIHLQKIRFPDVEPSEAYPFSLPLVCEMEELVLDSPVTYLVGENGSGKSTLIESVGIAAGLPIVGGQSAKTDPTLKAVRPLSKAIKWSWSRRNHRGFFFRAEDFFRFARGVTESAAEFDDLKAEYAERFKDRPTAYALTVGTMAGQAAELRERYGGDLHERSHGESFLDFFQSRLVPDGLYLMDEPEASLSPQRQIALLSLMREAVDNGSQFIIATHSPILMAFPDAAIYSLDTVPPERVAYEELEHVTLTRAFLEAPERFLRHL